MLLLIGQNHREQRRKIGRNVPASVPVHPISGRDSTYKLLFIRDLERVKGIEPSFIALWLIVAADGLFYRGNALQFHGVWCTWCSMASLYKKQGSKFWYVHFLDKDGAWRHRSTGLLHSDPKQTAEARIMKARLDSAQVSEKSAEAVEDGWVFAEKFVGDSSPTKQTAKIYTNRWHWVSLFLAHMKIRCPEQVEYAHAQAYIEWRTTWKKRTGKSVCRNTAIYEIKTFAQIMEEAFRRKLCPANPLVKLGLTKDDPDEKPEITDEEFRRILPALEKLPKEKEWMKISFLISMQTGCRLRETRIAMSDLDFENDVMTFLKPKGGKKRAFSIPIPPAIRPLLLELRTKVRPFTLEFPFQPSRAWQHFFHSLELDHLCFHCLRVTFITRLARKRVPLSEAMRLVNHASTTIHRIYQRLNVNDVRAVPQLFPALLSES